MKQIVLPTTVWFFWTMLAISPLPAMDFTASDVDFFEERIRPVLIKRCYECHSTASPEAKGGLLLDSRAGIRGGGESGAAVVPGEIEESLLVGALRHDAFEMPPNSKLSDAVIADFENWIRKGAADPRDDAPSAAEAAATTWKAQLDERSRWWSLQPLKVTSPPTVNDDAWSKEPVDQFIRQALEQSKLLPAKPADAETLLRRLSFVLTGLPPSPAQVLAFPQAFAKDSEQALANVADELLHSPHFGERFARHWMDVVRYTDTYGYEWDNPAKGSWEYRDYLIRAFNDDIGFDQLIREQIAGDLLRQPRINKKLGLNESMIGPMFYHMGENRHGDSLGFNGVHQEMVNNKIDAFSKAFLAMTVACARCHDHKLDAISQADYYALAGVFMSPRWTSRSIDAPGKNDTAIAELAQLREQIRKQIAELWTNQTGTLSSGSSLQEWAMENRSMLKDAKLDEIAWPLAQMLPESTGITWHQLAEQWRSTRASRLKSNEEKFTTLTDFSEPGFPKGWILEGDGITHGYVSGGEPLVSLTGDRLIDRLLPRGYHTGALSSKLPGAVRLPAQDKIPQKYVSLEISGGEWAGHLIAPQNAFQSEAVKFFDPKIPLKWTSFADLGLKNGVTRVLLEIATSSLNPNFPPRTGIATSGKVTLPAKDDGFEKRSWFSLTGIVTHEAGGTPTDTLAVFVPLFEKQPTIVGDVDPWQRIVEWFSGAIDRWASSESTPEDIELINWLLKWKLLPNQSGEAPEIADLVKRYREVEARIAFPRSVNSMDERDLAPIDYRLNVRGNVDEDGPAIPRDFLDVFSGKHLVAASQGSGRLELAEYLSNRNNPQTARVYVNRVWQSVFGRGIVATPSDFGKLGDRPSHPELLDWLADQFMKEGWSTKQLVRRLVISQTFRQSGTVTKQGTDRDPENRWFHHYPTRRLEAEAVRDNLLAVSGRLDPQLYGPPINPPRQVEDSAKRLFSGPLDSDGRRSIYMKMSIMAPPKFLVCFNLPALKLPTGRRDVTNSPAHALALLNNPLVVQLSDLWAERLIGDDSRDPEDRVRAMFLRSLGRNPKDNELQRWTKAVVGFSHSGELMDDKNAWAELAHLFFNTKEFIYYR